MLKDIHREIINNRLGLKHKEIILEDLRKGLVNAMRLGSNFVLNLDKLSDVDFHSSWVSDSFPLTLFDHE